MNLPVSSTRLPCGDICNFAFRYSASLTARVVNFFLWPLAAFLFLLTPAWANSQSVNVLYSFTGRNDGANPMSSLVLSDSTLYGTARLGGSADWGTVFRIRTDGSGFTNLYTFTDLSYPFTNTDGTLPDGGVVLSDYTLYGTTEQGGFYGNGTIFRVNTDGTGFKNLHNFSPFQSGLTNTDGANPRAGLIVSGNMLFGTAEYGGAYKNGTVFSLNIDGSGYTNLYNFSATRYDNSISLYTNSDGVNPAAGLILSGNTLYGTTRFGGSSGNGTVFKLNADGAGFTTLHSFSGDSDGANPLGSLIQLGGTLYGTTSSGTIFAINTNGGGFTNLHRFLTYADGASPDSGLIASGNTLYGTTFAGGIGAAGTLYSLNPDGAAFSTLYSFTLVNNNHSGPPTNVDGCGPLAGLVLISNTLYGATYQAGSSGYGTLFSFSIRPQLTITPAGASMILTWPTNAVGFSLQSVTNLGSSAWTLVSPPPLVINGQNTVTNTVSGSQVFYRLVQ